MDGNSSDNTIFRKTVTEFRKGIRNNLQEIQYWIADCKLYTDETIRAVDDDIKWISRVPDNIKEATREIENAVENLTSLQPMNDERYAYYTHESNYGGVLQRWLVIFSKEAQKRAEGTVQKAVVKEFADISVQSKKRGKKGFFCDADAQESIHIFQKKLKYHTISIASMTIKEKYKRRGRPSANSEKECLYQPQYCIEQNDETIEKEINRRSIFVVATNELSSEKLSDQEVFNHYKDQNKVEQGFRFLKDPLFFASSLFLKKPERIVALTMIMCLSLLVYSICERKLRLLLKLHGETIHSQVGKPTQRPTMRWIYQIFEDVHLVRISGTKAVQYEVTNLREDAVIVLNLLGEEYKKRYLLNQ